MSEVYRTHFKAIAHTLIVWLPIDMTDAEAEEVISDFEDELEKADGAVKQFAKDYHPRAIVE